MRIQELQLPGSHIVDLNPHEDERGVMTRLYDLEEYDKLCPTGMRIVQVNHQLTHREGTVRGLHFRIPYEQKAVRCIRGAVWDVIVDLRPDSPSYLKWYGTTLTEKHPQVLYIPRRFAHGTQALTDDAELLYMHSDFFDPNCEKGIRFDDQALNILWPLPVENLSVRDRNLPYVEVQP